MRKQIVRIPGLVITEHEFMVPLDYSDQKGSKIKIFAREIAAPDKEDTSLPWLVFLQGGPGFPSPRPEGNQGWIKRATQDYRVLLLDQRGTGMSSPILNQTLRAFPTAESQAKYLSHFRADSIVQDLETIREELLEINQPWSILGQSYGGFCAVHYLSSAPHGLNEVMITGGLPPLEMHPDEIYRKTYSRVIQRNNEYLLRYPHDEQLIHKIVSHLASNEVYLPNGDLLTPRRLQQLGIVFGMENGFEQVHYLIEGAFVQGYSDSELSYPFLNAVQNFLAFDTNPLYALLHEAIYCQGFASDWSADRVLAEFPEFAIKLNSQFYFTGEMVYPWMFREYEQLKPLWQVADILAKYEDWPFLYDASILARNQVPVAAAIYYDDIYVERQFSEATAAQIGSLRTWITNQYEHSALRMHGEEVLDRLLDLLHGEL